jgi:bacterioferritin-associated ferredoxin
MKTGFIIFRSAMYVCVCLAVTEAQVEAAIANGAHTRAAVTAACRAGGDCGACHGMIEHKIEDYLEAQLACAAEDPAAQSGPQLVPAAALVRGRAA